MLIPLYSHCYTPTCSSPQGAIFKEYQHVVRYVAVGTRCSLIWYLHLDMYFVAKSISTPCGWPLEGQNMLECHSRNKVVLTCISALVRFVHKIVTSVHGHEQHKVGKKRSSEMFWQLIECSFVAITFPQCQHCMIFLKFCQHCLGGYSLTHVGHCATQFAGVGSAFRTQSLVNVCVCVCSHIVTCCPVSDTCSTVAEYVGVYDCVVNIW